MDFKSVNVMIMKGFLLLSALMTVSFCLFGQEKPDNQKEKGVSSESIIASWQEVDGIKSKNSHYLNQGWDAFDLFLKAGSRVEGKLMRYNLMTNNFEVKFGTKIKVLSGDKVEYFEFNDNGIIRLFESAQGYYLKGDLGSGFMEVIVSGDPGLVQRTFLGTSKKKSKQAKLKHKNVTKLSRIETNFLLLNGQFNPISDNKEHFYSFFKKQSATVAQYVEKHELDLAKTEDLKKLILYIKSEI